MPYLRPKVGAKDSERFSRSGNAKNFDKNRGFGTPFCLGPEMSDCTTCHPHLSDYKISDFTLLLFIFSQKWRNLLFFS
jgi:hypothetical protein